MSAALSLRSDGSCAGRHGRREPRHLATAQALPGIRRQPGERDLCPLGGGKGDQAVDARSMVPRGSAPVRPLLCLLAPLGIFDSDHLLSRSLPALRSLQSRMPDTFNRNLVAGVTIMVIPFAIVRDLTSVAWPERWIVRVVSLGLLLAVLTLLAVTESRAGHVVTRMSLLMLLALTLPRVALWTVPSLIDLLFFVTGKVLGWPRSVNALPPQGARTGRTPADGRWSHGPLARTRRPQPQRQQT